MVCAIGTIDEEIDLESVCHDVDLLDFHHPRHCSRKYSLSRSILSFIPDRMDLIASKDVLEAI
eukprot:scaffold2384_cov143-Skeletonema_menzelii.AAC.15